MRLLKLPLRILAVMGKEVVEVLRRPRALVSIVAGPVLILGLFGLGYVGQPPLRAELVIPPGIGLPTEPGTFASIAGDLISIAGITPDPAQGRDVLRSGAADLLVIVPPDAKDRLARGEQTVLEVEYDTVSPYRAFVARAAASAIVAGVNREIIQGAAKEAADRAVAAGQPVAIAPEVVAAPTRADVANLAPSAPDVVAFYGIMVLALIVQHTVITVSALSMLHDRRRGMLDLFRISPIGSGEILVGKYAAFTFLGTVVALAVLAILVFAFGVPFLGGPGVVLGCLALLVVASIGIGTVVALLSDTDRQAIQISLLVLLASVFFSGLALDLNQFSAPVRVIGGLLPVTQAGVLLQDLLLRGSATDTWRVALLAAMAGGLFVVGWLVLRRQMVRPA
jgi:ABC-2 type transport system permease protein